MLSLMISNFVLYFPTCSFERDLGSNRFKQYFIYQIPHKYINLQFNVFQDLAVSLELISAISWDQIVFVLENFRS